MERREAIKRTAALMGGVVFAPTILGVLKGCTASSDQQISGVLFNDEQAALVSALSETIIPADELPGAIDAGVPAFIEQMIHEVYNDEQQEIFLNGLDAFNTACKNETGRTFVELTENEQFEFAAAANQQAIDAMDAQGPQFFLIFKELTMVGFFTSEPGATQVLQYVAVPGDYHGCMPLEEVGRTWAT